MKNNSKNVEVKNVAVKNSVSRGFQIKVAPKKEAFNFMVRVGKNTIIFEAASPQKFMEELQEKFGESPLEEGSLMFIKASGKRSFYFELVEGFDFEAVASLIFENYRGIGSLFELRLHGLRN